MEQELTPSPAIEILTPFSYKVIYVFRINDAGHKGLLKVGETTIKCTSIEGLTPNCDALNTVARERIDEYTGTAGITYELLHAELAVGETPFGDKTVHKILINSGFKRTPPKGSKGREWFTIDLATAKAAIQAAKEGKVALTPDAIPAEEDPIILRQEQRAAVDQTRARFKKAKSMLWNAKMRFGKTVATLSLIKESGYKRVIVITHRPVVKEGWFEDFNLVFAKEKDITFFRKDMGDVRPYLQDPKQRLIYFASIHDLRGSSSVGGKFEKNDEIYDVEWDLLVIDEAHEGTQTTLGQNVTHALVRDKTRILSLSGTPFNIQDDFTPEDVYTWDYIAEQRAKTDWAKEHEGDPNPYLGLPEMRMFTYALGAVFQDYEEHSIEGKCFNFREFFRTWTGDETQDEGKMPTTAAVGDFVHAADVRKFVELLRSEGYGNNYPFSTEAYRKALGHTLWKVPGVREAKALERLLKADPVFGQFEIVNVAGTGNAEEDEDEDDLLRVKEAIDRSPYTITLSCGRLTTGVTVKPWTGVLMLAGGDKVAAASYLQTIFRVQSPYTDKDGRIKDLCYTFDFAPDRVLSICPKMVQNEEMPGPSGGGGGEGEEKSLLGKLLNFMPIIAVKGSELHTFEVADIYRVIKRYAAEKAIRHGFADSSIYNFSKLKLDKINVDDFNTLRGIIGKTPGQTQLPVVNLSMTGMTEEERQKIQKDTRRPKRILTPEEKELLERLKEEKRQRQNAIDILRGISIRMPLLIYGASVDYQEEITIGEFVKLVDDESWEEFMPKGVTKEIFSKFVQYYDEGVFTVASREIRELARTADGYAPTDRVKAIAKIFSYFRNPDKETVLTPWRVVNMHLSDTVGGWNFFNEDYTDILEEPRYVERNDVTKRLFSQADPKILELNSKSGLYPLYLAYSIFREKCEKLKGQGVELTRETQQALWREIVKENIFVVCKTPMAKTITRRTLLGYMPCEAGDCNLEYFHKLLHVLKNNPAKFIRNVKNPKTWNKKGFSAMEFDAIVGNPPYQVMDGGAGASAIPIYHYFVSVAKKLDPSYISMITPARWMTGGRRELDEYRKDMINDVRLRVLFDYADSRDCFPSVDIAGGLSIFLWDKKWDKNECEVVNFFRNKTVALNRALNSITPFIRYNEAVGIVEKIREKKEPTYDALVSQQRPFGLRTYAKPTSGGDLRLRYSGGIGPYEKNDSIINESWIPKWKVIISYLTTEHAGQFDKNGQKRVLSSLEILEPNTICTETYLIVGTFDTKAEAENCVSYLKTRFLRFLISLIATTQHLSKNTFQLVPLQDFSKPWTDEELYAKYGLTDEEIAFIESMIRPMAIGESKQ